MVQSVYKLICIHIYIYMHAECLQQMAKNYCCAAIGTSSPATGAAEGVRGPGTCRECLMFFPGIYSYGCSV